MASSFTRARTNLDVKSSKQGARMVMMINTKRVCRDGVTDTAKHVKYSHLQYSKGKNVKSFASKPGASQHQFQGKAFCVSSRVASSVSNLKITAM